MIITFLGNFEVPYSSENHHALSLECLGHRVIRLQELKVNADKVLEQAVASDLFVWIHTHGWNTPGRPMREVLQVLREKKIPTLTYHLDLWMGLDRQKDMNQDDYWHIEHFFTVDRRMADWLNKNTQVKGHYMPAGVFHDECYMTSPRPEIRSQNPEDQPPHDIIFVGSKGYHPEWPYRPKLINWLQNTYGPRFKHFGGDGLGVKRGADLNQLYADSKIVIGDTLCLNYDYPDYWSDRVYETIGRGGFMIHPYISGMEKHFEDKKHLEFYQYDNFKELKDLIDYYLVMDTDREQIRRQGFEHVKQNHTYLHRWVQILNSL